MVLGVVVWHNKEVPWGGVMMWRKDGAKSWHGLMGNGTPLQCSCLENPMDGGAWWAAVYGVAQSWTWMSNFTFTFHFHALEKEMAIHSSVLAWRIPGMGDPGGLPSMGSHRVGHDWSDLAISQYSYLENSMDKWIWWATVHGVENSRTWLSNLHTHIHTHTAIEY